MKERCVLKFEVIRYLTVFVSHTIYKQYHYTKPATGTERTFLCKEHLTTTYKHCNATRYILAESQPSYSGHTDTPTLSPALHCTAPQSASSYSSYCMQLICVSKRTHSTHERNVECSTKYVNSEHIMADNTTFTPAVDCDTDAD